MKAFRSSRLTDIQRGTRPAPLASDLLVVVHLLPLSAFDEPSGIDIRSAMQQDMLLWPINTTGVTMTINFDGLLAYSPSSGPAQSYTQLFRDGCIEAVNANILPIGQENHYLHSVYEQRVHDGVCKYLSLLQSEGIEPPIFVALSLINAKGYRTVPPDNAGEYDTRGAIDRDLLMVPEARIDSFSQNYYDVLKEPFDRVWQACGWVGSFNYRDGKWIRKPSS